MTAENYLALMQKVEKAVGQRYGDERLAAMKEFLEHIPDAEWPGVVRRTLQAHSRTLPGVSDFCAVENRLW